MNRFFLFSTALFIVLSCTKKAEEAKPIVKQWEPVAAFPGAGRKMASSFVIGEKFYVGLGRGIKDNSEQTLVDFYEFNVTSNTWKQLSDFPGGAREFALGFAINGKGYFAIGQKVQCPTSPGICTQIAQKNFWEYDPSSDKWKQVGSFDGLPSIAASVFTINNKAYILQDRKLWEFDPAAYSVNQKSAAPQSFSYAVAFTLNNKGYVGTGSVSGDANGFFEYDPALDKWTRKADFVGSTRRSAMGFSVDNKGYIGGGIGSVRIDPTSTQEAGLNDIWEYNAQVDNWVRVGDFTNVKPRYAVTRVINGKALVGTGESYPNPFSHKEFFIF